MKIKVLDFHEKEKAESYFKGFETGVFNTVASVVEMRKKGLGLQKLYKLIEKKYKESAKLRLNLNKLEEVINENNSK